MTKPNYEFFSDERHGILRIVLRNHWDLAVLARFWAEEQRWRDQILHDPVRNPHRYLLIDASEHGIQSQEIANALRHQMEGRRKVFERTAIVVAGALHQMQANRIRSNSDDHRLCGSMDEALAWLSPGGEARASAA